MGINPGEGSNTVKGRFSKMMNHLQHHSDEERERQARTRMLSISILVHTEFEKNDRVTLRKMI